MVRGYVGLRLGLRMDFLLCPILRPNLRPRGYDAPDMTIAID